jgi:hypothetical protein
VETLNSPARAKAQKDRAEPDRPLKDYPTGMMVALIALLCGLIIRAAINHAG